MLIGTSVIPQSYLIGYVLCISLECLRTVMMCVLERLAFEKRLSGIHYKTRHPFNQTKIHIHVFLRAVSRSPKADMRYCVKTSNRLMVHLASVINSSAEGKEAAEVLHPCWVFFFCATLDTSCSDQNN